MGGSFYQELKSWQSAIGSLLGFFALMTAALWNFHLNRRRDARLRNEESLSVMAALYGEILLLRNEAARLARAVANVHITVGMDSRSVLKFTRHFVEANTLSEPILYKAFATKLGMLNAAVVVAITEFHSNFQKARSWLPLLVEDKERGYSYSVLAVLVPARDAVRDIVPTLRTMERLLSISKPADDPP